MHSDFKKGLDREHLTKGEGLSTVDLLIKVELLACSVTNITNIFNKKSS